MEIDALLGDPTIFLSKCSQTNVNKLLDSLKKSYDVLKTFESKKPSKFIGKRQKFQSSSNVLPSLLIDGFDSEQIWQQIELKNHEFRRHFASELASTSRSIDQEPVIEETDEVSDEDAVEEVDDDAEIMDDEEEQEDDEAGEADMDKDAQEKSTFERQQEKLHKRIEEYEEQILSEKPWQLVGEVTANKRPENSLLEEHLYYEHATKLPPVITQETTETLESLIIRRIKDQAWDDVERKVKPVNAPYVYKNELVLDQEKPKMSLSQVYEQEYLKTTSVIDEEKKNPKHEEIRKSMKDLFFKLDLLTSSRYTPKPMMPELKVVNNMPSIRMEEVAPVSVSDAAMLAPEEVKERKKGQMKAKEERSKTDKHRDLRVKKKKQKLKAAKRQKDDATKTPRDKLKMLRKVGRIRRVGKDQMADSAKDSTSSKDFFNRLQKQVQDSVSSEKGAKTKKIKDKPMKSAALYKT